MEQIMSSPSGIIPSEYHSSLRDNVRLLRLMTIVTAGVALGMMLLVLLLQRSDLVALPAVSIMISATFVALITTGATFFFLRQGQAIFAGRLFFYGLVGILTLLAALFGGASGPVVICYFIPIVAAGLIGESVDSLRVGALVALCYTFLVITEQILGVEPAIQPGPIQVFVSLFIFLFSCGVLATLAWVTSRDLAHTLVESHQRARELLERTEQLMEKNIQQVELGSELSTAAAQLQMTSQQQASGSAEQASAVSEISTTIEELGSTARQIAQTTEHVAQAAQQTLENLSNGQGAVDESIQAMERIRGRVQDVASRVLSLGERSQQIGEIIDLIDDISDETHLLALNAAIEAAGAGEHGRRFAVVAAEVKSLANRTLAAAKEVKGVIAEIRQATNAAVLAAEEGGKEVENGVELAHRAGQVMDTVVMVAERTAQSAAEIGLATAQQQSASEQVVETMREIAEVVRQSAAGAQQMAESAAMLTAIADRLHGIAQYS